MKNFLTVCGYNSALAFKSVDENSLSNLENYIEVHHRKTVDDFPEYVDIKPFEFLPGHRSLIVGIKTELSDIQSKKKQKVMKSTKPSRNEDENELRSSLVNQMTTYASGIGLGLDFSVSVQDMNLEKVEELTLAVCKVVCPACNRIFTIRYNKNWKICNIYRHLRTHVENSSKQTIEANDVSAPIDPGRIQVISVKVIPPRIPQGSKQIENAVNYMNDFDYDSLIVCDGAH